MNKWQTEPEVCKTITHPGKNSGQTEIWNILEKKSQQEELEAEGSTVNPQLIVRYSLWEEPNLCPFCLTEILLYLKWCCSNVVNI